VLEVGPDDNQDPLGQRLADPDNAPEHESRAGGFLLSLLARALYGAILRALTDGPMRLTELRSAAGGPAQTTLRGSLGLLAEIGALDRQRANGRANALRNTLTPVGRELIFVVETLEEWLDCAPRGPVRLDSEAGKATIRALVSGWDSTMLRALAARTLSLTELDNLINAVSYPSLERRLGAMRLAGQIKALRKGSVGGTPYAVTGWLRQGMAPLIAAARCERRHMQEATAPLTRIDVETILLLAAPLLSLPPQVSGTCQLVAHGGPGTSWSAGVHLSFEGGKLAACTSQLRPDPGSSVEGPANAWLEALVEEGGEGLLEVGGRGAIGLEAVGGLRRALFPA
jgi:DNA-binding HxlR family transcriptional regulator